MKVSESAYKAIPSIDQLLEGAPFRRLAKRWRREALRNFLQMRVDEYREGLSGGAKARNREEILERLAPAWAREWADLAGAPTRRVLNGTGVLLHTNLGRATLSGRARRDLATAARWPVDLELELAGGKRASRLRKVEALLRAWSGAPAALAVNNNAAALTLAVDTLARGRRLIVSRGEQVEIGGSFRLPEILERFAGKMVEVGTTNRTRLGDYARAITRRGDVLLKVHRSNFRQLGYTEEAGLADLAALGREKRCPVIYDLGSGRFDEGFPWLDEPTLAAGLAAGPDLITFSADKVFGGPQAGILLGGAKLVTAMKANPLARALRLDKLNLAALAATLADRMREGEVLPAVALLSAGRDEIAARARALAKRIRAERVPGLKVTMVDSEARSGGGAAAEDPWPSAALRLEVRALKPLALARLLRRQDPALLVTLRREEVLLDLAALRDEELPEVAKVMKKALEAARG